MGRFDDKVCVVVGAASELGAAASERFLAEGGAVVGVDLVDHEVGTLPLTADFTIEDQVAATFDTVVDTYGRLDVVYNNIGLMDVADRSAMDSDLDTWRRIQDGNLTTAFLSCKHAVPRLLQSAPTGGAIVNAASFLGDIGAATAPMSFSAAKAAVVQLTRDLAINLARSGIRVNAVLFGPIETKAQREMLTRRPDILPARMVHWPMGRYGTLAEAAGAVAFLASEDAGFVTGHALAVDGGITQAFTVPE